MRVYHISFKCGKTATEKPHEGHVWKIKGWEPKNGQAIEDLKGR